MHPDLEKLTELERADREIARLTQEVAALPARVAAIEQRLARSQAQLDAARARIKEGEAGRRKLEGEIQAQQQKISKYREQSSLHQEMMKRLRADESKLHVFKTVIPERNTTAMAVEHAPRQTFRQRYGYDGNYSVYDSLAKELRDLVGQRETVATA